MMALAMKADAKDCEGVLDRGQLLPSETDAECEPVAPPQSRHCARRHAALLVLAALGLLGVAGLLKRGPDEVAHSLMQAWEDPGKQEADILKSLDEPGFLWGAASSAYQVEGAVSEGGRTRSMWDDFAHAQPPRVWQNENADRATDFYHKYEGDLDLLDKHGFNTFRFSISWTRVLPMVDGKRQPNPEGIAFYKKILEVLKRKGITPLVTMYHWDLPSDLTWLETPVIDEFVKYADFLWEHFPEVDHWVTFNEPTTFCVCGYEIGIHAPGIKQEGGGYICGHHVLLAHAKAVRLFKQKYASKKQNMQISMTTPWDMPVPRDPNSAADIQAVETATIFGLGRWVDPVYFGDYPKEMREKLGDKLPKFTEEQKEMLKGSYIGYYGMNTYGGRYAFAAQTADGSDYIMSYYDQNGHPIGTPFISAWFFKNPVEIYLQLKWVQKRYNPESIIITENGCSDIGPSETKWTTDDSWRVDYYREYLANVARAKAEGVPVKGYVAWALTDNFEWADGYKRRFGLTYVNFETLERTPKSSAYWFQKLLGRMRHSKTRGLRKLLSLPGGNFTARRHQ
eukprot:TRINITY_DN4717_c0_g1_i1.p1 TRINITY_DN4717_c0_g1~~TRINITY_DN4717_c0_g1_i1.p1  ORF type:complete len:582 (-),score=96.21 TRINITY_DN4717_c0_g1_i1:250-1950(-)